MTAAAAVVAERGLAGATLTAVTERAGISKGLLWRYFTDAEDLLQATGRFLDDDVTRRVVDAVDVSAPAPDVVRATVRALAALTRTHAAELRALTEIARSLRTADGDLVFQESYRDPVHAQQERLFARGQREATVRDGDVAVMAVVYQGALDAMVAHLQQHPEIDPGPYADAVTGTLLAGFAR